MKIKHISNSNRSQTLSSPSPDPKDSPCRKLTRIRPRQSSPKYHEEIQDVSCNVNRPAPILVQQRDPEQSRHALEQSTIVEEVRRATNPVVEIGVTPLLEIGSHLDHDDCRSGGHEVAHNHCERDEDRDVDLVSGGPGEWSINMACCAGQPQPQPECGRSYHRSGSLGSSDGAGLKMISFVCSLRKRTWPRLCLLRPRCSVTPSACAVLWSASAIVSKAEESKTSVANCSRIESRLRPKGYRRVAKAVKGKHVARPPPYRPLVTKPSPPSRGRRGYTQAGGLVQS